MRTAPELFSPIQIAFRSLHFTTQRGHPSHESKLARADGLWGEAVMSASLTKPKGWSDKLYNARLVTIYHLGPNDLISIRNVSLNTLKKAVFGVPLSLFGV